jgi:hypothetical protein
MKRSLSVNLKSDDLNHAPLDGLVRLATFLGVSPQRKADWTDKAYRHAIVQAVMRWEAHAYRGRVGCYADA